MGRLRISAGRIKGRRLSVPPGVRPSGSRLREALFSHWGDRIGGCRFLDLFAGSGAVALEAWSRGAERCVCVEASPQVLSVLRQSCRSASEGEVTLVRARLPEALERDPARLGEPFDLAFADPPYDFDRHRELLAGVARVLVDGGRFGLEHPRRADTPEVVDELARYEVRRYGDSVLSLYERSS